MNQQQPSVGQQPYDQATWNQQAQYDCPTVPNPPSLLQTQVIPHQQKQLDTLWQRYRRSRKAQIGSAAIGLILVFLVITVPLALLAIPHSKHPEFYSANPEFYPANIEYDPYGPYGWYEQSNLTNPNIGGVDINMNWAEVEPQQGVFNWKPADDEMAAWSSHGKKFTLIIRYVHQQLRSSCTVGQQWLPVWEVARIPTFCSAGGDTIPDYFDTTFESDLKAYISTIAQHIAASPYKNHLEYVRIGVGMEGEGYTCIHCSSADMQQLATWGYSTTAWAQWQKAMLMSFKSFFSVLPSIPLIYPLGNNKIDPATNQPISQEVAYWAAAHGIGVGQQGLQNTPGYAKGLAIQIMQYVRSQYPSAYIQFQTVARVKSASDVQGDIVIAANARAFSIEWFAQDSINPTYQSYFQQWLKMVDSKSATKDSH